MPAASPSNPVKTRSISSRPAFCCALILLGSSGAGAWVKRILSTSFGFALRYFSMLCCVSRKLPATSKILSVTGDFGGDGISARTEVRLPGKTVTTAAEAGTLARNCRRVISPTAGCGIAGLDSDAGEDIEWVARLLADPG